MRCGISISHKVARSSADHCPQEFHAEKFAVSWQLNVCFSAHFTQLAELVPWCNSRGILDTLAGVPMLTFPIALHQPIDSRFSLEEKIPDGSLEERRLRRR
jgi:hypothetical protein